MDFLKLSFLAAFLGHCFLVSCLETKFYAGFAFFFLASILGAVYAVRIGDKQLYLIQLLFAGLTALEFYRIL